MDGDQVLGTSLTHADKETIAVIFQKYDSNLDGLIDGTELTAMLTEWGVPASNQVDFLKEFDTNNDGKLSQEEFECCAMMGRLGTSKKAIKQAFDLFDDDGDGKYCCFLLHSLLASCIVCVVDRAAIFQLDPLMCNVSLVFVVLLLLFCFRFVFAGYVTLSELQKMLPMVPLPDLKAVLKSADTNNDGKIEFDEWFTAMIDHSCDMESWAFVQKSIDVSHIQLSLNDEAHGKGER